jgi:hypothetical protein
MVSAMGGGCCAANGSDEMVHFRGGIRRRRCGNRAVVKPDFFGIRHSCVEALQ